MPLNNQRDAQQASSKTVIGDIAEKTGFSATTISRVLNGHPDVSAATRNKILQHVRELGYVSPRQARTTTQLVGLTIPMFNNYFGRIIEGAYEALSERNAQFVIARTNNRYENEVPQIQQFLHQNVNGILFMLPQESSEELLELQRREVPFVVVDPYVSLPIEIPVVTIENISAAMGVIEHLLGLGHRRIAVITGPNHWKATIDRLAGYYSVLGPAGIPIDPSLIKEGRLMADSGAESAEQLFALPDPPTAIFAFNDDMAIGALNAAWKHGLRVPEDISIVGFDDALENLPYSVPPLTTVRQPLREVGHIAVDVLYRVIQHQPLEATHIKLSTRLITRGSTGPAPKKR